MHSCHLTKFTLPSQVAYRMDVRMVSSITGKSGRVYKSCGILQRHREDQKYNICKAKSGDELFVFKCVPKSFYDFSLRFAAEFQGSSRLRIHTDHNEAESILVYSYFRDTLLALITEDPDFPVLERKKILRQMGYASQELYRQKWIHIDVKPDNILVNWTYDEDSNKTVSDVVLGDFDIAFKSANGEARQTPYAIGNAMWRSPEGQTGRGVTKASDVFSFGLVCIYALGGGDFLLLNDFKELAERDITPEQEILVRHFTYFGLVPQGLLKQVNDENWSRALLSASQMAEQAVREQPELKFESWGEGLGSMAQKMIAGMTNPGPTTRLTIDQVMSEPWWLEMNSSQHNLQLTLISNEPTVRKHHRDVFKDTRSGIV